MQNAGIGIEILVRTGRSTTLAPITRLHVNDRFRRGTDDQNSGYQTLLCPAIGCAVVIMIGDIGHTVDGVDLVGGVIVLAVTRDVIFVNFAIHFGHIQMTIRTELQGCRARNRAGVLQLPFTEIDRDRFRLDNITLDHDLEITIETSC